MLLYSMTKKTFCEAIERLIVFPIDLFRRIDQAFQEEDGHLRHLPLP